MRKALRTALTKGKLLLRGARARIAEARVERGAGDGPRGGRDWLIEREIRYGGYVTNVPKRTASPLDPAQSGFLTGGDRMLTHGYAAAYARHLARHLERTEPLTVVEVGILRGSGLALWCDLFPKSRVIGLDIDLRNYLANRAELRRRGAFHFVEPEVYEFDQFGDNREYLAELLRGARIDVAIDDGCHSDQAVLCTMRSIEPHLNEESSYFIEDNRTAAATIRALYAEYAVETNGELTVLWRRSDSGGGEQHRNDR